jgi:superfamily II DNA or RNA helicase
MPSDILIIKKDEVFVKLICEKHIQKELSAYFTFSVPGCEFTPSFKSKKWDGLIRLFNLTTKLLYIGLLDHLENFCKDSNYTLDYGDTKLDIEDEFSLYHTNKFLNSLNLHSQNKKISAREHQVNAIQHIMQKRRALVLSPTASGKSLILYALFRQFLDYQDLKGLIVVPTTALVEQLYSDFEDYSSHNGFSVENNVHRVYEGKDKQTDDKLVISTWQSLYTLPEAYFKQFDYVICDEAHLAKADSLTSILKSCTNTKYRVGLTGTLDGTITNKFVLEGVFGSVRQVITTKELIDKKELSDFTIKCLILNHPESACRYNSGKTYQDEIQYLIGNEQRNKFIKNLAISLNKNTLILYQYVDKHGLLLYNMIKDSENIGDRKVFFVHGNVDTADREYIRSIMETENNAIVVASVGTFSTGTNIRNLHNVIFASPSKSRIRNLQSIGRVLRQSEGKLIATLYDIADDMRFNNKMNFTLNHFTQRIKIYISEKFPYKIYKIGLKE